jgi:enoyl-[acyl-carrier-protein] reductase (NADH)
VVRALHSGASGDRSTNRQFLREETWSERAPLGWDVNDSGVVARACLALLSDLLPMTTGEILHVDGGVHAVR